MRRSRLPACAVLASLLGVAWPSAAPAVSLSGSLGAAVTAEPRHLGAAAYDLGLRPTGRFNVAGRLHADLRAPATASLDVVAPGTWRFAALGQYLPGRSAALRERYDSLEGRRPGLGLGAMAERSRGPLSFRVGAYRAVARPSGGWGGWAAAEAQTRLGLTPWVAGLEGVIEAGDGNRLAQRLGVTADEADGASSLTAYRPTAGISRATARLTGVYLVSRDWALAGRGAVTWLGPALAASPLADTPWQGRLSAALLYRF